MTNELKLAALLTLTLTAFSCGRAQWQEDRGNGALAQQQDTSGAPGSPNAPTQTQTPETPLNPGQPPITRPGTFPFDKCQSQTLSVEVTYVKGDKAAVQDFWTTTARYPKVKVTQVSKKSTKATFYLNAGDSTLHSCTTSACADQAGWTAIQNDLVDLNGVSVRCLGAPTLDDPPPEPAPTPANSGSGDGRG